MCTCKLTLVENRPIVTTVGLKKNFDTVCALNGIDLEIGQGRIIGLLGPNGSGKTTLLKILAGLYTSYEGKVEIDGQRPGAETKARVSYLPDRLACSMKQTPKEIRAIYTDFFEDFQGERFDELMEKFEISQETAFNEMSKGMIDKVQISFVMSRKARLYLLDEPLGGVDVAARDHVLDTILENFDPKATIIVATHLISEIERLFDSVIVLKKGQIVLDGSCDEIRQKYGVCLEQTMKEVFSKKV